ncbi:MAG: YlxM family DNA-binding protein [Clostridia bacterium]|nr:YlxM family DNA-binding protein [Clostridia bacterium]
MDNVYEISLLLDFYGQLLTDRQYEILDLHVNHDYSLGEIAEQLDISRQGVFDNMKRAKAALHKLEEKLGLVQKFSEQKKKAEAVLNKINEMDKSAFSEEDRAALETIRDTIEEIINA